MAAGLVGVSGLAAAAPSLAASVADPAAGQHFVQIDAGATHTCGVTAAGAAYCWGINNRGQLGDGTDTESRQPVPVQGLTDGVTSISAGATHTCAVAKGDAYCWGSNLHGQLGDGTLNHSTVPVPVHNLDSTVSSITAGGYHSCAITTSTAHCWGYNILGQLGNGTDVTSTLPFPVKELDAAVNSITAGEHHTCAVMETDAYCWGWNAEGQLGDGTNSNRDVPVEVQGPGSDVTSITAGTRHSCAVMETDAYCWGDNQYGQLGDGDTDDSNLPVAVHNLGATVTSITAGQEHSCAVMEGAAHCWGNGWLGRLGNGTTNDSTVPVPVQGLGPNITAVSAGGSHTCAVRESAYCWGWNSYGQLGDGTTNHRLTPVAVLNPTATSVSTSPATSQPGAPVTLTATMRPTPSDGTVTFREGDVTIRGCEAVDVDPVAGTATCPTSFSRIGAHHVSAVYSGAPGFPGSTSPPVVHQVVAPPPSAETWTPVFEGPVTGQDTATSAAASGNATAEDGCVRATGFGAGGLAVATYADNPGGPPRFNAVDHYFDVQVHPGSDFAEVTVRCTAPAGNTLYWWDGTEWQPVQPQSFDPATGAVTTTITEASSPSLAQMHGTVFGLGSVATAVRHAGADRIGTAVAISQATYPDGEAGAVVLARADDYADALAGGPLAVDQDAPLLLTPPDRLAGATRSEIQRVLPTGGTVHLLGGTGALSQQVATAVADLGYRVRRIAGQDRYGTAVAVARELGSLESLFLAAGTDFPDALAASTAAVHHDGAVLLTSGTTLPAPTRGYLTRHGSVPSHAIGGPAAAAVTADTEIVGRDRYHTAAKTAMQLFDHPTAAGLATGTKFPDALTAAAQLGRTGAPLLLTRTTTLPTPTGHYLTRTKATLTRIHLYGGHTVLTPTVAKEAILATHP